MRYTFLIFKQSSYSSFISFEYKIKPKRIRAIHKRKFTYSKSFKKRSNHILYRFFENGRKQPTKNFLTILSQYFPIKIQIFLDIIEDFSNFNKTYHTKNSN